MKLIARKRRHKRITKKLKGSENKPRLVVFRSKKHLYAQLINDRQQKTITGMSTSSKEFSEKVSLALPKEKERGKISKRDIAKELGLLFAKKANAYKIKTVCFDRAGYLYHGRIKSFAEGAREGGLKF